MSIYLDFFLLLVSILFIAFKHRHIPFLIEYPFSLWALVSYIFGMGFVEIHFRFCLNRDRFQFEPKDWHHPSTLAFPLPVTTFPPQFGTPSTSSPFPVIRVYFQYLFSKPIPCFRVAESFVPKKYQKMMKNFNASKDCHKIKCGAF